MHSSCHCFPRNSEFVQLPPRLRFVFVLTLRICNLWLSLLSQATSSQYLRHTSLLAPKSYRSLGIWLTLDLPWSMRCDWHFDSYSVMTGVHIPGWWHLNDRSSVNHLVPSSLEPEGHGTYNDYSYEPMGLRERAQSSWSNVDLFSSKVFGRCDHCWQLIDFRLWVVEETLSIRSPEWMYIVGINMTMSRTKASDPWVNGKAFPPGPRVNADKMCRKCPPQLSPPPSAAGCLWSE